MGNWGGRKVQQLAGRVFAQQGRVCHLCGMPGADTIDHLTPRAAGGTDELDNLAPAHSSCNSARGSLPLAAWFARYPLAARADPSRDW